MQRTVLSSILLSLAFVLACSSSSGTNNKIEPACTEPPPQMAAWWPFNEPSGTIAADLAGEHPGEHHNGVSIVGGKVGHAIALNGIDGYVSVPHDPALDFVSQFSVDFWIKPDTGETAGTIIRKGLPGSSNPYLSSHGFHLFYNAGHLLGALNGSSSAFVTDFTPQFTGHVQPGVWTFVALTIDLTAGTAKLYIDGQLVQTQTPLPAIGSLANPHPLIIGGTDEPAPSKDRSFAGTLDELELFNRILGPEEIAAIHLADWSGKCGSPNCTGPEVLRVGSGDGALAFYPDEAGALFGCSGGSGDAASNGIRFDPAGAAAEANVNCSTVLYVFDQAKTRRQALSVHATKHNSCSCTGPVPEGGPCFYEPLCEAGDNAHLTCGDITSDTNAFFFSPAQMRRTTTFTLPNFPALDVQLVQDAYIDRLEQTYRFTNKSTQAVDLRLARVADGDIPFNGGYQQNLSASLQFGASISDAGNLATLEVTAPQGNGSDAAYEGARLQGNGGSAHGRTWWNYGVPTPELMTYAVDDVYWSHEWSGTTPKQGTADQAVVVQSTLTIPAGQTKTYVTVTTVK